MSLIFVESSIARPSSPVATLLLLALPPRSVSKKGTGVPAALACPRIARFGWLDWSRSPHAPCPMSDLVCPPFVCEGTERYVSGGLGW
ncbi:hypothetical protein B0H67DRAFT_573143 [Lasiosphaeris hirsuta]|uniref:Uncharacterized protein n=1 Tax=Lasiosphaeris hirsuta TaxID=260670 RepID=A0AA40E1Q8_9PEZI|nr:hypothetical protein B0H67DRAFT_573143 [Lasiosphaeris hirsuta]